MAQEQQCQCQSGTHGHRPGKCATPATEDGMCKRCHEKAAAEASPNPFGSGPFGAGPFGPKPSDG